MWLKRKNGFGFRRIFKGKTIHDYKLSELKDILNNSRLGEAWKFTYKIRSRQDYLDVKSYYWKLVIDNDLIKYSPLKRPFKKRTWL